MNPKIAYLTLIVIWSTTPLAIKWSGEGPGFLFGVASRMTLGTVLVFTVIALTRTRFPLDAAAWRLYAAGGIGVFFAMFTAYWGLQFVPSGWLSVLHGLTPIFATLLSIVLLADRSLTRAKVTGQVLALCGLAVVFATAFDFGAMALAGSTAIVAGSFCHALSGVLIQRLTQAHPQPPPALALAGGALLVALPAYLLTFALVDGRWPESVPPRALASIVYLGTVATLGGFTLYYFVLRQIGATRVAMIGLIAPVAALTLGTVVNGEPVTPRIVGGTLMILAGLYLHELYGRQQALRAASAGKRGARVEPAPGRCEDDAVIDPSITTKGAES